MEEHPVTGEQKVVVTDIRMPFWSMVVFMVKWAFASIPAMIVLFFVVGIIMAVMMTLFGAIWGIHGMFPKGPVF
ncbi:MAG: hypothetical protein FDX30_06780 [Chlorobium sp.]|nr:MAG: hypothetical protein FDX30_06780 [Chlorobium sp.]